MTRPFFGKSIIILYCIGSMSGVCGVGIRHGFANALGIVCIFFLIAVIAELIRRFFP